MTQSGEGGRASHANETGQCFDPGKPGLYLRIGRQGHTALWCMCDIAIPRNIGEGDAPRSEPVVPPKMRFHHPKAFMRFGFCCFMINGRTKQFDKTGRARPLINLTSRDREPALNLCPLQRGAPRPVSEIAIAGRGLG